MKNRNSFIIISFLFLFSTLSRAQEVVNEYQTRTAVDLSYKPIKKLKLSLTPELRFDETFTLDKYHIEATAAYKFANIISFGATYRFIVNPRETKTTEYSSRYAFHTTIKKSYGDFDPSFRISYTNDADDNEVKDKYWRFKAALKYDIPNFKFTPLVGVEAFSNSNLEELYKMRYIAGVDYKIVKNNYIGLRYKLDYYQTEYRNRHIIGIEYKIKF